MSCVSTSSIPFGCLCVSDFKLTCLLLVAFVLLFYSSSALDGSSAASTIVSIVRSSALPRGQGRGSRRAPSWIVGSIAGPSRAAWEAWISSQDSQVDRGKPR